MLKLGRYIGPEYANQVTLRSEKSTLWLHSHVRHRITVISFDRLKNLTGHLVLNFKVVPCERNT